MIIGGNPKLLTTLAGLRREPPLVRRPATPSQPASALVLPGAGGLLQMTGDPKPPILGAGWSPGDFKGGRREDASKKTDADRLAESFLNGDPPQPEVIQSHLPFLLPRLSQPNGKRDILPLDQKVEGSEYPLFSLLGLIPAPYERVWKVIEDSHLWEEWMPFVLESRRVPGNKADEPNLQLTMQLFKMLNRLLSFHYEVEIQNRKIDSACRSLFRLVKGKLDDEILTLRLKRADGSWTIGPVAGQGDFSYVAYQIHLEIDLPESYLEAWTIKVIREVMYDKAAAHFSSLFWALTQRSMDFSWKLPKFEKPSAGPYQVAREFLRREFSDVK